MDTLQLKNKIIQRIVKIEDKNILDAIHVLFSKSDEHISKFLKFENEKMQYKNANETEDFTDYIKEWVKNM